MQFCVPFATHDGSVASEPPEDGLPGKKPTVLFVACPYVYDARYDSPWERLCRICVCSAL